MSCNGCRVLRKGCSEGCMLRPCLQWIEGAEAQGHATVFVAKFFGRAGLMSFISAVPPLHRPALFQSLLYEACGRTINPVTGAVGLLAAGNWHLCQAAVDAVFRGCNPCPTSGSDAAAGDLLYGRSTMASAACPSKQRRSTAPAEERCDLDLGLTPKSPPAAETERKRRRRLGSPSMNSEGSVTTSVESDGDALRLLKLFL